MKRILALVKATLTVPIFNSQRFNFWDMARIPSWFQMIEDPHQIIIIHGY